MKFRTFSIGALLIVFAALARAENKPDPRENLDTAIPEAIRLLEKKDYEGLLKAFVAPMELERITSSKPLPEFAKLFGENKAELLLKVLLSVKGTMPTLSEDKATATFELQEKANGKGDIQFQKIDKYWYIKN
jgi:hypothetical protein